ncbi:nucleoside/nucleotide kinase family protein [Jatrophihabitans fulvus]
MDRHGLLSRIVARLDERSPGHPLRAGVDGVCGSGKTTFARELTAAVAATGRPAARVDSDGFHHLAERRRRNRDDPARGYYDDAYDFAALEQHVLLPLGPGGSRRFATRVMDLDVDRPDVAWSTLPDDGVLLFDCTFLQRGGLRDLWDEVVFLDTDLASAQARGIARDAARLGGPDVARHAYETRYMAACRLYLTEEDPLDRASIVVRHDDPRDPELVRDR